MADFIYVADTYNHRVVKRALPDLAYDSEVGSVGSGNDQFQYPIGMTVVGGNIYVADSFNNRIVVRAEVDLSFVSALDTFNGSDTFSHPEGVDNDGTYLIVSDTSNCRIIRFLLADLSYVDEVGSFGSGDDQFNSPKLMTNDGTYLYVADHLNNRVVKRLLSDLSYVGQVAAVAYALGVANDGTHLYVTKWNAGVVQKFLLSDLSFVAEAGSYGTGNENLKGPAGIATDSTNLYIADSENNRIVTRLASDLSLVSVFGSSGSGDDEFNVPQGVWSGEVAGPSPRPPSFDTTRTELIGQARLSVYLNEEVEAFDVFSTLNAAVASYLFNDHLGKYRYVAYVPPAGATLPQFTEDEIFSFVEDVDASKIISRVKAKFQHRVTQDYWQVRFVDRPQSQHLKRSPVPILKEIEFPFVQASDGLKGGQRAVLMEGVPQRVYKAKVSSKGWTLLPADFIQVTYARHGINGIFEVLETKRDLKTGKVDLVVGGLRGITGGGTSGGFGYPGHWCDDEVVVV